MCETREKSGADAEEVLFRFDGLRIVNGAQTVGSISKAMTEPDKVERAQVPIRFIKLKSVGPEFGARVTYATNRSNPMQPRDLLAMDHVQQRLRDDFKLTWGFTYAIRANDDLPEPAEGCSALEAVIAMAAGLHDIRTGDSGTRESPTSTRIGMTDCATRDRQYTRAARDALVRKVNADRPADPGGRQADLTWRGGRIRRAMVADPGVPARNQGNSPGHGQAT